VKARTALLNISSAGAPRREADVATLGMRFRWMMAAGVLLFAACSPATSPELKQPLSSSETSTVSVPLTTKLGPIQPLVVTLPTVTNVAKVVAPLGELDLESRSSVLLSPEGVVYVMSYRRDTQAWVVDIVDGAVGTSRRYQPPEAFSPDDRAGGPNASPVTDWLLGPNQVLYATSRLDWSTVVAVPTTGERSGQIVAQAQRPAGSANPCHFISGGITCDGDTVLGWVDPAGQLTGRTYEGGWTTGRPDGGWLTNATGQPLELASGDPAKRYEATLPSGRAARFEQVGLAEGYNFTIRTTRVAKGECALAEMGVEWHVRSFVTCVGNDGTVRSCAIPQLARSTYTFEAQMITDEAFYFLKRDPAGSSLYRFRLFADT
jgi:hypothetical protein